MRWVNIRPSRNGAMLLGAIPLLAILVTYLFASAARHADNPSDKLLPTPGAMVSAMHRLIAQVDPLSGNMLFWMDTAASLQRLGIALGICTLSTLLVGMVLGVLPVARATLGGLVTAIAVIPPIALLPILFIVFGLGETAKVALIVIGVAPFLIRDLADHVARIPQEQLVKAQTLGASSWQLALRVALPQAMPRLIAGLRLSLGPAWVYLISAEAIASDAGLGYRIFLVRRYLSMDVIIPYVAWISLLAIAMDVALAQLSRRGFAWAHRSDR
ncbi:ABC transporter permease [Sphingomonas solaris]|uniref:ABC transporter permease n=1 Tax=Alterirhizorhabdus solaris TaxID=2529389 RepID=A0A558RBL8_9SPHN|nr:ABC transporter permease [Sphingomonas solaris]TVV76815.1 ABC transporter permease [Sphingomonas solaris]